MPTVNWLEIQRKFFDSKMGLMYFRFRQALTLLLLPLGYLGYYYCRSAWAIIQPVLLNESAELPGVSLSTLGLVASSGVLAYAITKLLTAPLIDVLGGRSFFALGLVIAAGATIALGLGVGLTSLLVAWIVSQAGQSIGWGSLLKMASHWFSFRSTGQVLGLASLSYLFGDALVRWHLGVLLETGYGWRGVAFVAAAMAAGAAVLVWLLLRTAPPPEWHPHVPPTEGKSVDGQQSFWNQVQFLLNQPAFWLVLLSALALHTLRETFINWSVAFLVAGSPLTAAEAAQISSVFPLAGGVSALLFGWFADLFGARLRNMGSAAALLLLGVLLTAWGSQFGELNRESLTWMLAGAGLLMIGPFSLLAGVMALDLGTQTRGASTANLIDGVGYLGGLLAGWGTTQLVGQMGWSSLFPALAVISWVAAIVFLVYSLLYTHNKNKHVK